MLRTSLKELDEKTIANALGIQSIGRWLNKGLLDKRHSEAAKAFNANKINLQTAKEQDFYTDLYRQYTANLLKLVIYVRSLMNNAEVKSHLQTHHADLSRIFKEFLASAEG